MKLSYYMSIIMEQRGIFYAILSFIILFNQISVAQDKSFPFELFTANFEGAKLNVVTTEKKIIFKRDFSHPAAYTSDLDEDGIDELIIIDSILFANRTNFNLFVFNTLDSFFLADSVNSGSFPPYETPSEETAGMIIVSGNPDFEEFSKGVKEYFLPINCWKYEDASLSLVNNEIYDIFISENEFLIDYINKFYLENEKVCNASQQIKPAIASAFANYINGGEESVASHFLKNYYLCEDFEEFRNQINKLLNKGTE